MEIQKCRGTKALKEASLVKKWPDQYRLDRAVNSAPAATQLPEMQGYLLWNYAKTRTSLLCSDSFIVPLPLSINRSKYFSVASSSLSQFNGAAFDPLVSCGSLGLADGSKGQRKHPQGVLTQEHPQFVSTYHKMKIKCIFLTLNNHLWISLYWMIPMLMIPNPERTQSNNCPSVIPVNSTHWMPPQNLKYLL